MTFSLQPIRKQNFKEQQFHGVVLNAEIIFDYHPMHLSHLGPNTSEIAAVVPQAKCLLITMVTAASFFL